MNPTQMLHMLELSASAYHDTVSLCPFSTLTVIENTSTDTECFVCNKNNHVTITFRGTDSGKNWLSNFMFCQKTVPYNNTDTDIRIHRGFSEAYTSVRRKIHALLPQGACKVTVTGHSLGGALALLCAVDIEYNFPEKDISVYVFGCPRVGNAAFAKSYNKRVFKTLRVTNGNDIVAKVPPALFGYRHVGIPIHIGKALLTGAVSFRAHEPREYYRNLWEKLM